MARPITYGMVGGSLQGFIGEVHRKAIQFDPRAQLVCGCFSGDAQRNAQTAEAYGVAPDRTYSNYQEMAAAEAARQGGIDFACIVTPNHLHYEMCRAFLEAGIHVVCEKPLCFSVEEAEALSSLAQAKKLVLGVTYAYTGYTMVKVAKEMIASGSIGEIIAVNAEYIQDWLIDELQRSDHNPNPAIWRTDPRYAGAANCVGDIGTHTENMVHYLTGLNIHRLAATVNRFGHTLDFNANMLVEYENGANGAYWCSQVAAGHMNGLRVRVFGTLGALEWEQETPDNLRYTKKGEAPQTLSRACGYLAQSAAALSRLPCGHPEGLYVGFANIYRNIISTILRLKSGEQPTHDELDFPTVSDGVNGMKFVSAVLRSGDNGGIWVDV